MYPPDTLGYHHEHAIIVFGKDSPAVKFLDKKISESPNGRLEKCIAHETQMVHLLTQIHVGKNKEPKKENFPKQKGD